MNRFNHREYSQFKNSLVSTYLSYCEYYRLTVTLLPLGNMWTPHILSLCLNQASLLHSGECAELCLLQEVDGVEAVHENTCQDGLPVHLWHPAGWPVWGCSNQTQGDLVGRSSWRNLAPLSRASACLLSSGVPFLIYNFFFTKWFVYNFCAKACHLSVEMEGKRYDTNTMWRLEGPYRTTTVRDTLSDLPRFHIFKILLATHPDLTNPTQDRQWRIEA